MEVDEEDYTIEWVEAEPETVQEEFLDMVEEDEEDDNVEEEYLVGDEIIPTTEINTIPNSLDQIAAENLIYMAHDGNVAVMGDLIEEQVEQAENADYNEHQYFECQVTEEVITDDWVQQQGEDRVEVPVDQLGGDIQIEQEIDVPLPTDQDEYTASRPYPCDFCSRRFRKKANLMNHMVAHKHDRPHICNLCGARYIRRVDLLNHLKVHAQVPEQDMDDMKNDNRKHSGKEHKAKKTTKSYKTKEKKAKWVTKVEFEEDEVLPQLTEVLAQPTEKYPVIDPSRPFVCQYCGVSFAREKALLSHSRMHGGDSPYECDSCSEMFWDVSLLREHQKIHHAGQTSNSEYEPDNEKDYTDSETDSKYGEFYCSVCGMSFHRHDLLKRHSKMHVVKNEFQENVSSPHCCNVCGESFMEALDLLAHAEVHARFQPFKCTLCGETFIEQATIKKHIANVHGIELTENTCRLCGKHCRDSRSLMKHAWEHSREKNHSCSKCGKTFHNKARLKRHMQSHRNKSVACEVCGENFPDGRSFMNHRHSHNNVSGKQFPCKECGKTFGSRSSQQIHMRIHTGERPYGCRFCWKAFADGGTLRKHERIHTGEKPYVCPVCPRAFNQRVVLREHIRSHHSGPDAKRGNSLTPYYCSVCGDTHSASASLIQHLIEHSDLNTAMKRQPATGPRKYKRRRKLKPHELERLRSEKTKSSDFSDDDENGYKTRNNHEVEFALVDDIKPNQNEKRTRSTIERRALGSREKKISFSSDEKYNSVFTNLEDALQNIDSLVVPSSSSNNNKVLPRILNKKRAKSEQSQTVQIRPKMIHTEKTRVPVVDGKRKSKTLITRSAPKSMNSHAKTRQGTNSFKSTENIGIKHEDLFNKGLSETELLLELSRKKLKYSPDVVNDLEEILRSPIKSKDSSEEFITSDTNFSESLLRSQRITRRSTTLQIAQLQPPIVDKRNMSKKCKIEQPIPTSNIKMEAEEIFSSDDLFTCEMCSAVFRDRAQLLVHVPIHI